MSIKYEHLMGKPFVHSVDDCYTHLQSMFMDNCQIKLSDYARPDSWWTMDNMNLYMENFKKEGFRHVDLDDLSQIRLMDVFLIAIPDPRCPKKTVVNHCAVYVGDGKVTHHMYGRMSECLAYRGALRNFTVMVIRHKDVPDLSDKTVTKLDIMDRLLPHKREMLQKALDNAKDK